MVDSQDHPASEPPARSAGRRRVGRIVAGALAAWVGLVLIVGLSCVWILSNLDHRWVKGPVERLLSEALGTDVAYDGLSISLSSGIEIEGLVIATPESLRAHADEMLRLDALSAPIELRPLLSGQLVVPEIRGGPLSLTVVTTEDGRDSISELFDPDEETEEAATPLSHSLQALEDLGVEVGPIALAPIRLRGVEVEADRVTRDTRLEPLGLLSQGVSLADEPNATISIGPHERTDVVVAVLEPPNGIELRHARVAPHVLARLERGRTIVVEARATLEDQALFPELRPVRSLLRLEARADFDAEAATTTAEVSHFSLLDELLVASLQATVHDATAPREESQEAPVETAAFSVIRLDGRGTLDAPSLPWSLDTLTIVGLAGNYTIEGLEVRPAGVVAGAAHLDATVGQARYDEDPALLEVKGGRIRGSVSAPVSPGTDVGSLALAMTFERVRARERDVFRSSIRGFDASVELSGLGTHDAGMLGLRGTGQIRGSVKRFSLATRDLTAAAKSAVALSIDMAKSEVDGALPIDFVTVTPKGEERVRIRNALLRVRATEPTYWSLDLGTPSVEVDGSVEHVSVGERRFRVPSVALKAIRTAGERYALDASATADRVSWGRFRREPPTTLDLDVTADLGRSTIQSAGELAIAGRSPTTFSFDASHGTSTTRYALAAEGRHAGPILGALLFGDGGMVSDQLRFSLASRGAFRGLLRRGPQGQLVLSREPARTTRGSHRTELNIHELSLTRLDLVHQVEDLTTIVTSSHEAPGKGSFDIHTSMTRARYGELERPMTVSGFSHQVGVAYAALYGAPSFVIESVGALAELDQPYLEQYPVADVTFGLDVDVDDTRVYAVRQLFWRNPAGGTRLEAKASYEGWSDALRETEVCTTGTRGCPEVASLYGREAAKVTGTFEQDFSRWRGTDRTRSAGSLTVPFTVESGDLNTYRLLATARIRDLALELTQYGLLIDDLDAQIPIDQEYATEPELFVVPTKASNAMARKRFFDLYPFTERDGYLTVDRVRLGREEVGPVAANVHVVGSTFTMDQIHAAYREGFVTGQFLANLDRDDPELAFRGHLTGVRVERGKKVLDANLAMSFVPTTLIVEGKAQVVRISKDHLYAILDVLDPYHEDEDMNRVRLGLKFGYPKYVRVNFDEGLMDTKIDLGGLAGAVRIDEIRGIPVTPFLEQYVQPYIERVFSPSLLYEEPPPAPDDAAPRVSQAPRGEP